MPAHPKLPSEARSCRVDVYLTPGELRDLERRRGRLSRSAFLSRELAEAPMPVESKGGGGA
jgi:hypothetical protein